jgi:hypothetical protein
MAHPEIADTRLYRVYLGLGQEEGAKPLEERDVLYGAAVTSTDRRRPLWSVEMGRN